MKIGVIGVGGRGVHAHQAHRPEEDVEIVAGADVSEEALAAFKEKFKAASVDTDYRRLLEHKDIDAVFVTSPDFCHEEQAAAALEAGKAVYLEKPMAITIQGADRILRAAKENKAKLFVGHNMRYMSIIRKMKELIDKGAIGEVKAAWCRHFVAYGGDSFFKDWHSERKNTTGMLLQKGAHDIDVLHWLCASYTKRDTAFGGLTVYDRCERRLPTEKGDGTYNSKNWPPLSQTGLSPVIDIEDQSMVLMELGNNIFASYLQCHFTPDAWRNYTFIGTEGRLENIGDSPDSVIRIWNKRREFDERGDEQIEGEKIEGGHGGSDVGIIDEFIRFVREGGSTYTDPIAARYSVAVGHLATESLRSGGTPFDIPPLPAELEEYFLSM